MEPTTALQACVTWLYLNQNMLSYFQNLLAKRYKVHGFKIGPFLSTSLKRLQNNASSSVKYL